MVDWAAATRSPGTEILRSPPFSHEDAPEIIFDGRVFPLRESDFEEPECTVSDIVNIFKLSAPTISHHLKELVNANLISTERRGKYLVAKIPSMFGFFGFSSFNSYENLGEIPFPCPGEQAVGHRDRRIQTKPLSWIAIPIASRGPSIWLGRTSSLS